MYPALLTPPALPPAPPPRKRLDHFDIPWNEEGRGWLGHPLVTCFDCTHQVTCMFQVRGRLSGRGAGGRWGPPRGKRSGGFACFGGGGVRLLGE